jgi:hypothetical protein
VARRTATPRVPIVSGVVIDRLEYCCGAQVWWQDHLPGVVTDCSFKIFGKLLTSRLEKVCGRLIEQDQSAFIRGRYILDSVIVAHEMVHSLHGTKTPSAIIMLDYEKAYDRVNLDFLFEILRLEGFSASWICWIRMLVLGGIVSVMINGEESNTFKSRRGLR